MTTPTDDQRLSVVLPCYSAGAPLIERTLQSYAGQTALGRFEVLLIDDGAKDARVLELSQRRWPFPVRYRVSPRLRDARQAHKNHARNIGWRHAAGPLCLMVDCDCLAPPDFVEQLLATWDAAGAAVLHPLIVNLRPSFDAWIERHGSEALRRDFARCLAEVGVGKSAFAGHYEKRSEARAAFEPIKRHGEGYPVLSKRLLALLGGFDEDFLAWGGNKEELARRINETRCPQALATSCVLYHQPHPKAPDNRKLGGNAGLMHRKGRQRQGDPDWRARRRAIGELPGGGEPGGPIVRIQRSQRQPGERTLFCGPWVGEFGWQLCRWQAGVRQLACQRPDDYLIVMTDPGCEVLYEAADEVWWTPAVGQRALTRNMTGWLESAPRQAFALDALISEALAEFPGVERVAPRRMAAAEQRHIQLQPDEAARRELALWRRGWPDDARWVVLFPRQRALNPQKNWPVERWQALAAHLATAHDLRVIIAGGDGDTAELALSPEQALDLRQIPLERRLGVTLAALAEAEAAVASESGGAQLALLAGTASVVLGGPDYERRVTVDENPLGTACAFLASPDYAHELPAVQAALDELLEQEQRRRCGTADAPPLGEQLQPHLAPGPLLDRIAELPAVHEPDRGRAWFSSPGYYPVFSALASLARPRRLLEVGSRRGYSLVAFAHGAPTIERIVAIDDGSEAAADRQAVAANLAASGYAGELEQLKADSLEALPALAPHERFDLILLDADGERPRCEQAIGQAWELLAPGGWLLVDDIDYLPEVGAAFSRSKARLPDRALAETLPAHRGLGVLRKAGADLGQPADEASPCPVCEGQRRREPEIDGTPIASCQRCGLIGIDLPAGAEADWGRWYREPGAYHRARQLAGYDTYLDRYLHDRQLARLRLDNLPPGAGPPGRLLDVGCSNGALVKEAADRGWQAEGLDLDPWLIERASDMTGCRLHCAEPLTFTPEHPLDLITCIDSFEHFLEPNRYLARFASWLAPDGQLLIEMPDASQAGLQRLGSAWRHFKPREHAFFYGPEHVARLAQRHGLTVRHSWVPYPDRRTWILQPTLG